MRKILSVLLAVCLLVSFVPLTASAAGNTLKVGTGQTYTSIRDAVTAAQSGDTINLSEDYTATSEDYPDISSHTRYLANIQKNLTIDLGGRKLTALHGGFDVTGNVTVTIKNGTLVIPDVGADKATDPCADPSYTDRYTHYAFQLNSGATLNIASDATIETADSGIRVWGKSTLNVEGKIHATATTDQGRYAIYGNGSNGNGNITINIKSGAEVTSKVSSAIYMPNTGTVSVTGGTVSGRSGIYVRNGNVTISNGTIKGIGDFTEYKYGGTSYTTTGDALVIESCNYGGRGAPTVTISGGTFTSTNAKAIGSYAGNGVTTPVKPTITGGTFSSDPTEYLGSSQVAVSDSGSYKVYTSTDSTVSEVPTSISGSHANPEGVVKFSGKTVTVSGQLPYITGKEETAPNTPAGNYVWVKISLPTGVSRSNMTLDGKSVSEAELDDTDDNNTVDSLCCHLSITAADVTAKSKTVTVKWNATTADVFTIDLTNATLEAAPNGSNENGGSTDIGGTTGGDTGSNDSIADETYTSSTVTTDDGTTTTTTTWSSGKSAVTVKTPDGDVTTTVKSADGKTITEIDLPADPGKGKTFSDVTGWSKDAVTKATAYGLFSGTSATTFDPEGAMSRGMLAQVLYNLSGKTGYGAGNGTFNDVNDYYNDAVDWAAAAGVASGHGNGTFAPDDEITREQMVMMLYNYARIIGAAGNNTTSLDSFPDAGKTSDYATTAMQWAVANGLISGRADGGAAQLAPQGTATREEVASVLVKFVSFLTK